MAIMSVFGQSPVHRLIHTFQAVKPKCLEIAKKYDSLFSSQSSYKNYRAVISQTVPPAIPFLFVYLFFSFFLFFCLFFYYRGVYLTDLTFIDQGNEKYVEGGLVNFRKKQLEYDVIIQVLRFQETPYQFAMVIYILFFLFILSVIIFL